MDRIHCYECGFGVVTDPAGRCPDGHAVAVSSLSATSRLDTLTTVGAGGASTSDLERDDDANGQALVAALEALADTRAEHAADQARRPDEAHPPVDREVATVTSNAVLVAERPAAPEAAAPIAEAPIAEAPAAPDLRNFTSREAHVGSGGVTRRRWPLRRR